MFEIQVEQLTPGSSETLTQVFGGGGGGGRVQVNATGTGHLLALVTQVPLVKMLAPVASAS
jgi:hypothetical protein